MKDKKLMRDLFGGQGADDIDMEEDEEEDEDYDSRGIVHPL